MERELDLTGGAFDRFLQRSWSAGRFQAQARDGRVQVVRAITDALQHHIWDALSEDVANDRVRLAFLESP